MLQTYKDFLFHLSNNSIIFQNKHLNDLIYKFSYHLFTKEYSNNLLQEDINYFSNILQKCEHQIMFISEYIENKQDCKYGNDFYILCIELNIIIIEQNEIIQFFDFFWQNKKSIIYILSNNIKTKIEQTLQLQLQFSNESENHFFHIEIESFCEAFSMRMQKRNLNDFIRMKSFFQIIIKPITCFLIKKSYYKLHIFDRIENYEIYKSAYKELIVDKDEYVTLRRLYNNYIYLIYHIKREELFTLKIFSDDNMKLFEREHSNYLNIHYPLFPRYFGITQFCSCKGIIIEYIQGKSMYSIEEMKLNDDFKYKIIFQIMIGIQYLHFNNSVYRDLKPDNIIIDDKNSIYIIDLDKMVDSLHNNKATQIFQHEFIAPEIINGEIVTTKADIYSLGKIIEFIFLNEFSSNTLNNEYLSLKDICHKCTLINPEKRPDIKQLIDYFYLNFYCKKTKIDEIDIIKCTTNIHNEPFFDFWFLISEYDNPMSQYHLALLHKSGIFGKKDFKKIIKYLTHSANRNCIKSLLELADMYYDSESSLFDINMSIYYYTLAANLNDPIALFSLGAIYESGDYVPRNINKAIDYYIRATDLNNINAQINLGIYYYDGKYIKPDIEKSIYFFTLAANQNDTDAQISLASIYENDEYGKKDINKSIYYYTLAANQNVAEAQFKLGIIFEEGKSIEKDINKSIYYYTLASNQNYLRAQHNLGLIYCNEEYSVYDIDKAIYYFKCAADQNLTCSQYNLGMLYLKYKNNINKSLYYFTLAANQNDPGAQYNLGCIYESDELIPRDIDKSIYYYTLASNQNFLKAQINLGFIYMNDKDKIDRDKAIHFLTLASNQNYSKVNNDLGCLYLKKGDTQKAIHYLLLSAKQNDPYSLYNLGLIYENDEVYHDMNKSIQYYFLAAKLNYPDSLLKVGYFYLEGKFLPFNINKSIFYLTIASQNKKFNAYFYLGSIYFKGMGVPRDINKAIYYFKEGSSFNNKYSKNNLGIIYKNIKKNRIAIEYFEEAIRQKNDPVSMYNLGHEYFYGQLIEKNFDKSIELLVESSMYLEISEILLAIVVTKKLKIIDFKSIVNEMEKHGFKSMDLNIDIYGRIKEYNLEIEPIFERAYSMFENIEFVYNHLKEYTLYSNFMNDEEEKVINDSINHQNDLTNDFYEGFGFDLLKKL